LKTEAEAICGGAPAPAPVGEEVVGVVTWVDGTLLDSVRRVTSRVPGAGELSE
jgi:citrate lyase subunit alpha/citrate CoA-transferase